MGAVATQSLPELIGRYEVLGRLAMGGMAEILLARLRGPSGFERPVVIKRILPHYAEITSFVDMFLDEARIAARIAHPNVVQVHELGRTDEELFIVMEYIEGESLAGLVRRTLARALRLAPFLAAHVCAQACAGLHAAHELRDGQGNPQNLVHRDVSPQNLVVTYDGVVKILDFGIAQAQDRIAKTEAGVLKGKFDYMSPEQAEGLPLDRRSDVFSLGIVLYEISTGHRLFKRETATATLRAVMRAQVPPPSEVVPGYPPVLERICTKALSRHPGDRYQTAADMRRDLVAALRQLDGDPLPDEALAAWMRELFPDRIEEKRRMLEYVRSGSALTNVPLAEIDPEIEIPLAESVVLDRATTEVDPPRRRPRTLLVTLAAAAVLIGAGVGVGLFLGDDEPPGAPVRAAIPEPTEVARPAGEPAGREPAAPEPREVTLRFDTMPEGAEVILGGSPRGTTPLAIPLPEGDAPLSLVLRLDGYRDEARTITPNESQLLRIDLSRLPRRPHATRREEPPTEMGRSFRRFD